MQDAMQIDGGDELEVFAFCCQKHTSLVVFCGECNGNCCVECIDPHNCGDKVFTRHNTCHICCAIGIHRVRIILCAIGMGVGLILVCSGLLCERQSEAKVQDA